MTWNELVTFAAAMVTITNPIGNAALFIGMAGQRAAVERHRIVFTTVLASAIILLAVTWAGESVLGFFGVSIPALQATGGVVISMFGLSMLHARPSGLHSSKDERDEAQTKDSIAIVPLAMPIIAGPGTITTVIVATHGHAGVANNLEISSVCLAAVLVVGACFLAAGPIARVLGLSGMNILTRFMGLILTAIAIGMLAEGVKGLLPGLA